VKTRDLFVIVMYLLFGLSGTTLIKLASRIKEHAWFEIFGICITPKFIVGIICYGISFLIFIFMVSKLQISIVIPLVAALNSIAVIIIGIKIFGESINTGQMVGVCILVLGVFLTGYFTK
jgi:multidrug transporter EmrE-like cation transporter